MVCLCNCICNSQIICCGSCKKKRNKHFSDCTLSFNNKSFGRKYEEYRRREFPKRALIFSIFLFCYEIVPFTLNLVFEGKMNRQIAESNITPDVYKERVDKLVGIFPYTLSVLILSALITGLTALCFKYPKMKNYLSFILYTQISIICVNLRDVLTLHYGTTYGISTTMEMFLKFAYSAKVESRYIEAMVSTFFILIYRWNTAMLVIFTPLPEMIMNSAVIIGIVFFTYVIEKREKLYFYYQQKVLMKNEWLRTTLDNIQSGLVVMDKKKITYFNDYVMKNLDFLLEKVEEKEGENILMVNPNRKNKVKEYEFIRDRDRDNIYKRTLSLNKISSSGNIHKRLTSEQYNPHFPNNFISKSENPNINNNNNNPVSPSNHLNSSHFPSKNDLISFDSACTHKKEFNKYILDKLLLRGLENINTRLSPEIIEIINSNEKELKDILKVIEKEHKKTYSFQDFIFLGTKRFEHEEKDRGDVIISTNARGSSSIPEHMNSNNNSKTPYYLEIFLRVVEKEENSSSNNNTGTSLVYEFIFNDVTRSKVTEEAKAQIKYKSMFLAKVAHEFKNPLIIIKELVDQIIEDLPSVVTDKDIPPSRVESIVSNLLLGKNLSSYLLILVKDFEVVTKKENSSKIELIKSKFDLREEMSYLEQIVQTLISKKYGDSHFSPIKFTMKIEDGVPEVIYTDKTRLNQILINLVSNSIKFTQAGEINLTVHYNSSTDKISFSVKDSGSGVPECQVKNLFRYFYKTNDLNNDYGSGLGLSIVKELCLLLGGDILYTPNTPKGSDFSFEIDYTSDNNDDISNNNNNEVLPVHRLSSDNNLVFKKKSNFNTTNNYIKSKLMNSDQIIRTSNKNHTEKNTNYNNMNFSPYRVSYNTNNNKVDSWDKIDELKSESNMNNNNNNYSRSVSKSCKSDNKFGPDLKFSLINLNKDDSMFTQELSFHPGTNTNNNNITQQNNNSNRSNHFHHLQETSFKFAILKPHKEGENFVNKFLSIKKIVKLYSDNTNNNNNKYTKLSLIIADDEAFIRKSTIRQLDKFFTSLGKNLELTIIEVSDGIECLYSVYSSLIQNVNIDLIISDETMKYMNGSYFSEIMSKLYGSKIPVAIVTAYEDKTNDSKFSSQAIIGVFSKPINSNILKEMFLKTNINIIQ